MYLHEARSLGQAILRKYVRPVAQSVGIQKCIGWHTFRHTYSTLLRSVGTEFKVMQELLRHSTLHQPWMCIPRQSRLPNMQLRQQCCPWCSRAKRMEPHNRRHWATLRREVIDGPSRGRDETGRQKGHEHVPFCALDGSNDCQASVTISSDLDLYCI